MARIRGIVLVTGLALALAACTSQPADDEREDQRNGTNEVPEPPAGEYSLAYELQFLHAPSHDELVIVQATNFALVGDIIDSPKPAHDAPLDDLIDWLVKATFPTNDDGLALNAIPPSAFSWGTMAARTDDIDEGLGVSLRHVTQFTEMIALPDAAMVMRGPFDPDRIESTLGATENGLWSLGEERATNQDLMYVLPPTGAGIFLAPLDGPRLLLSRTSATTRAIITGTAQTLADDADLRSLAEAFDEQGWYTAMLFDSHDFSGSPAGDLALDPFNAMGAGLDVIDGEVVIRLAYVHDDAPEAEANESRLTELLRSGFDRSNSDYSDLFELIDTTVSESVLVATLRPLERPPGSIWSAVQQRDGLATHR